MPEIVWKAPGLLDSQQLEGFDVLVHLAGENIAQKRWTPKRKTVLYSSRVVTTALLCETIATLKSPPHTLISASATGYYGNRDDEVLDEHSSTGTGFLAMLCAAWEAATRPAQNAGIRVVQARSGVVLSANGGALKRMLPLFRMGLGASLGSGTQYMSWISIGDWLSAIDFIVGTPALGGPVNIVAPQPVTNKSFSFELAKAAGRGMFLRIPRFALRLALGELAEEALLASQRVIPAKLNSAGFKFQQGDLRKALNEILADSSE